CFFDALSTIDTDSLSLHDALPICGELEVMTACTRYSVLLKGLVTYFEEIQELRTKFRALLHALKRKQIRTLRSQSFTGRLTRAQDRKSTRLNSSHVSISYAVFCLK